MKGNAEGQTKKARIEELGEEKASRDHLTEPAATFR